MPDWKEMYLTLMRDTERAIGILTESQRRCEELYLLGDPAVGREDLIRSAPEPPEAP